MEFDMTPERWESLFEHAGVDPDADTSVIVMMPGPAIFRKDGDKDILAIADPRHQQQWAEYAEQRWGQKLHEG